MIQLNVPVAGRIATINPKNARVAFEVREDGIFVRIDDESNLEFWLEFMIPAEEIRPPDDEVVEITDEVRDAAATAAFGMTKTAAHDRGVCIRCKLEAAPRCHTEAGHREYQISGLCEECFDKMFQDDA